MSSSTPTYPCELTCAILFFSSKSGEWDRLRRAWGLGILSKWEHIQNENRLKIRTPSKWEHTQNGNASKMRTPSKWEHTQNGNAFKMRTHSKWKCIQNENTLKMRRHSKWGRIQNENTVKMRTRSKWERIQNERTYAKWERPQNGNTLKMTKQSAIKIQDNSQNTGNPSVNFTRLILTHIKRHKTPRFLLESADSCHVTSFNTCCSVPQS